MALPRRDDRAGLHDAADNADGSMGFVEHLDELRARLIRSCGAIIAAPMLAMYLLSIVVAWLAAPRGTRSESDTHPHLRLVVAASLLDQARRSRW